MPIEIHATLGPASSERCIIEELLRAGTDVFRLNLSHCQTGTLPELVKLIRKVSQEIRKPVQIAPDIRGRKVRLGPFDKDPISLATGQNYVLYGVVEGQELPGDEHGAWVNDPLLPSKVTLNTPILLDDGALRLRVRVVESHAVICQVEVGGPLPARSGLNIPGVPFDLPPLGFKDLEDLDAISKLGIDAVYLSYVETANDIRILRDALCDRNCPVPIIAKIERRVALTNLDDITATADAICFARGDLGADVPVADLPFIQRQAVAHTHAAGKPFILAGEILYSLISRQIPARAELTDVATALQQRVDGFILSDETAIGIAPVEAVRTLTSLIDGMNRHLTDTPSQ